MSFVRFASIFAAFCMLSREFWINEINEKAIVIVNSNPTLRHVYSDDLKFLWCEHQVSVVICSFTMILVLNAYSVLYLAESPRHHRHILVNSISSVDWVNKSLRKIFPFHSLEKNSYYFLMDLWSFWIFKKKQKERKIN